MNPNDAFDSEKIPDDVLNDLVSIKQFEALLSINKVLLDIIQQNDLKVDQESLEFLYRGKQVMGIYEKDKNAKL